MADQKDIEAERTRIRSAFLKLGEDRGRVTGAVKGLAALIEEDMEHHRETIMMSVVDWYVTNSPRELFPQCKISTNTFRGARRLACVGKQEQ